MCKVLLFCVRLWLCGFCPGSPLQNSETGQVSSLGPSEAIANPPVNGLDWTVMHDRQYVTGAVDCRVEYVLGLKSGLKILYSSKLSFHFFGLIQISAMLVCCFLLLVSL